jgi:hypothetical protein
MLRGLVRGTVYELSADRVKAYFFKQALHGADPHFSPVIPLCQCALSVRTGDHAYSPEPAFKRMEHILRVYFPAARDFFYPHMQAAFVPLNGRKPSAWNAVFAQVYDNVGMYRSCHKCTLFYKQKTYMSILKAFNIIPGINWG